MTDVENPPIPTDREESLGLRAPKKSANGWKVATAIFAVTALGASAWGVAVSSTNEDLETQLTAAACW